MRIGLMAIRACAVRNRSLEISPRVASHAGHIDMFAEQGKLRLRMVECRCKAGLLPCGRSVAGIASLLELALVWISMAVRAACERQPCIARLPIRPGGMAALAQNIPVFTS
jgi:hypothetical protein